MRGGGLLCWHAFLLTAAHAPCPPHSANAHAHRYGQITLTIKSEEPGVFLIDGSFLGVTLPEQEELKLDDLLTMQYNHINTVTLFDSAKLNVNLLVFLINKKWVVLLPVRGGA